MELFGWITHVKGGLQIGVQSERKAGALCPVDGLNLFHSIDAYM